MSFIFNTDGKPFNTAGEANYKVRQERIKGKVVKHGEGGYVIETNENDTDTNTSAQEEQPTEVKKKHKVTKPWQPASRISIPEHLKIPGFRYRSCNTRSPGNIQKKVEEGWIVDKELSKKMEHVATVEDGHKIDGTTRFRELIVMRIPEEVAQGRDEYYAKRSMDPKKQAKADLRKIGIQTYEPKEAQEENEHLVEV